MTKFPSIPNGSSIAIDRIPLMPFSDFRQYVLQSVEKGARVSALFAQPDSNSNRTFRMFAVLAWDYTSSLSVLSTDIDSEFPSLTPNCEQVHLFEREIAEQYGVVPAGHPWMKPVRFPSASSVCGVTNYFSMKGEELHEVAVGPVHAGIIEPGHFRFQCHGETVYHLEISLGYQHRGIEHALIGGPTKRTIPYMETLAGDTTIGHATAYSMNCEALANRAVSARAQALRGIALELERIANHIGDLGALAGDIGFLPTQSFCGRIRGDVLNATAVLCGNRFGRGLVQPGGTQFDISRSQMHLLKERLRSAEQDAKSAIQLLWDSPSVMSRFESTGIVDFDTCERIGLVGLAARACGSERDVRKDFPFGIYQFSMIPVSTWDTGDVFARALIRWREIRQSFLFIQEQLQNLPEGISYEPVGALSPGRLAVALVEGWRGEICHVATTDSAGRFSHYKVVDPSFHNWFGLACAMRNQQISDFPLCNKSFNLSYCGHDL